MTVFALVGCLEPGPFCDRASEDPPHNPREKEALFQLISPPSALLEGSKWEPILTVDDPTCGQASMPVGQRGPAPGPLGHHRAEFIQVPTDSEHVLPSAPGVWTVMSLNWFL